MAPQPGSAAGLEGVFCTSAAGCWTVGYFERNGAWLNETLRWDGHRWSWVAAPSPGGTANGDTSELFGVRCTAAKNCWAVGFYEQHGVQLDEALHWNGKAWSLIATPNPGGTGSDGTSALSAIRCPSAGNCWAVGTFGTIAPGGALFNEAMHWNGHNWSAVPTPEPDSTGAFASNVLVGVNCSSPDNCWAVGYVGNLDLVAPVLNEALHWNGSHWSMTSVPDLGGHANDDHSFLYGVRCTSRANCWAAGQAQPSGVGGRNQLMHWNGTRWSAA